MKRKKGRGKRRTTPGRNRKKDLPVLNNRAFRRIGDSRPADTSHQYLSPLAMKRIEAREPFPCKRELGETIGFYNINGKTYLGRPDDRRTGMVL